MPVQSVPSLIVACVAFVAAFGGPGTALGADAATPPAGALVLFDGKDTSAWVKSGGTEPCPWKVIDGAMEVGGGSIETRQHFQDFVLHVEFRTPARTGAEGQGRGNSGVYLQGRYEVQVLDSFGIEKLGMGDCGSIYGKKIADRNVSTEPETWQSYDITYTAARYTDGTRTANPRVTVLHNGVAIHQDVELAGDKTTSAPWDIGAGPGPIYLQDHGNPVRYRNIWILAKPAAK